MELTTIHSMAVECKLGSSSSFWYPQGNAKSFMAKIHEQFPLIATTDGKV